MSYHSLYDWRRVFVFGRTFGPHMKMPTPCKEKAEKIISYLSKEKIRDVLVINLTMTDLMLKLRQSSSFN